MSTQTLARLLRQSPELAGIREKLELVRSIQERYLSVVPAALASSSRVCAIDGATVVVRAASAPVAAALRAMAPTLLAGLRDPPRPAKKSLKIKREEELIALRVEVQVETPRPSPRTRRRDAVPVEQLADLARGLADSPLKDALERLVRAHAKRSTRAKR